MQLSASSQIPSLSASVEQDPPQTPKASKLAQEPSSSVAAEL